jgi:hypothetical protein
MCREHAPEALAALLRGLSDPKHYVNAATALLDRGFGKPNQPIEAGGQSINVLHLVAAREISAHLQSILAGHNGSVPTIDGEGVLEETEATETANHIDLSQPAKE